MTDDQLIASAVAARERAYAPYSNFKVGAALRGKSGRVYSGCTVENAAYGLSMCAERTAIFKAISEGEREFTAIAVATDESKFISPCGACRQVIMDLAGDIDCVLTDKNGAIKVLKMNELLPHPFTAEDLLHD